MSFLFSLYAELTSSISSAPQESGPRRSCTVGVAVTFFGAIALSYPPRVRVRATVKLSAAFFNDESSITIGGVRKSNSALSSWYVYLLMALGNLQSH